MKSLAVAVLGVIFFGGFGILCLVWAAVTLQRGEYLTAITVMGFAGFCFGLVVPFITVKSGKVTARGAFDAAGTLIRPDRGIDFFVQLSVFGLVVGAGLFALLQPYGKLDIPVGRQQRYSVPFMAAATAVMGAPYLWQIVKRGGTKYLRLTPDGFEFAAGLSSPGGEWVEVRDVTDQPPGKAALKYSAIVMVMSDGKTPSLAAGSFTPDGKALRQLVRFYWQHPEHRPELTDGRALQRLSNEQFDVNT
jgi:hypothetical protein